MYVLDMQQMEVGLDDAMVVILSDVQLDKPMVLLIVVAVASFIVHYYFKITWKYIGAGEVVRIVSRLRGV